MIVANFKGDRFGVLELTYDYCRVILKFNGLKVRLV